MYRGRGRTEQSGAQRTTSTTSDSNTPRAQPGGGWDPPSPPSRDGPREGAEPPSALACGRAAGLGLGVWVGLGLGWVFPLFFFFSFFLLSSSFWLFFLSFCFLQTQALEGGSRGQGRGDRHADACFGGPQLRLPPRLPSPSPSGWNQDSHRKLFTAAGRRGPPSRGSGRSATCRRGGARRGSPRTGWCGAGPARRCTG